MRQWFKGFQGWASPTQTLTRAPVIDLEPVVAAPESVAPEPETVAAPKRSAFEVEGKVQPPEAHAAALISWLADPGGLTGEILATELIEVHRDMCMEIGWQERPWNPIARELTRMTTGKKTYRQVLDAQGKMHRLRVYHFGAKVAAPVVEAFKPKRRYKTEDEMAVRRIAA